MPTLRAVPCAFLGVRIAFMDHLNDQMTAQAHCGFAVDELLVSGLAHDSLPFEFLVVLQFICR